MPTTAGVAWPYMHACMYVMYLCVFAIAFVHLTSLDLVIYPWNAETAAFEAARCDMRATRALVVRCLKWHGGIKCHTSAFVA